MKRRRPQDQSLIGPLLDVCERLGTPIILLKQIRDEKGVAPTAERATNGAANLKSLVRHCSHSGSVRSTVPGSQRSNSIAPRSASASISRTVGSPFQKRSPSISSLPSMRHADLQYSGSSVSTYHRCRTGATRLLAIERSVERQRPLTLQLLQHVGQLVEPCRTIRCFLAVNSRPVRFSESCHSL